MNDNLSPLTDSINYIIYFGDIVFAVSGALTAMRYRMDIIGVILIGVITGLGGGTLRDLIIDRPVFWAQNPTEIFLCIAASAITFYFVTDDVLRRRGMIWGDAMGLAAFGVAGCHIALEQGVVWPIAILMGMVTATGGGVIRDVITNTQPMITSSQPYATIALIGASLYTLLLAIDMAEWIAELLAFSIALTLRAISIHYDIRMGPRGAFLRFGGLDEKDG